MIKFFSCCLLQVWQSDFEDHMVVFSLGFFSYVPFNDSHSDNAGTGETLLNLMVIFRPPLARLIRLWQLGTVIVRVKSILSHWTTRKCSCKHVSNRCLNDMLLTHGDRFQYLLGYMAALGDMLVGWTHCLNWAYVLGLFVVLFHWSTRLLIL